MRPQALCGTEAARARHRRRNEPCDTCGEAQARHALTTPDLLDEIRFLLNAGEGEHSILKALGYAGREKTLRGRLVKAGRRDIANRIFSSWDLAA